MPDALDSNFQKNAQRVADLVFDISDNKLGAGNREAIIEALEELGITPEQEAVIERYASPTYRALEEQNDTPAKRLAHTLRDPLGKLLMPIQHADMFGDPEMTFDSLVNMDRLIDAQTHNYTMIFSGTTTPEVKAVLDTLQNDLKPVVEKMISDMEEKYDLNREDIPTKTKGWEHVEAIPADEYEGVSPT